MGIEYELKFRATEAQQDLLRQEQPGAERRFAMETTYYDTPDHALSRQHCTLRRRMENEASVCTLKTPAGDIGRREFEVAAPDIRSALPELSRLSGIPLVDLAITPVCGAKFTRIAKTICLPDCTLELALDRGILTGGGREQPLCEVEVELKSGSLDAVCAYGSKLAQTYRLTLEKSSKFRRAMLLAAGEGETL